MERNKFTEEAEKTAFIEKVAKGAEYSHVVFGCFPTDTSKGHYMHEPKGPQLHQIRMLFRGEYAYDKAFGSQTGYKEFVARVVNGTTQSGDEFFILTFNDRKADTRPASHSDYAVIIPQADRQTAELIRENPEVLIGIFQKVYPKYDRSEGLLAIDQSSKVINFSY